MENLNPKVLFSKEEIEIEVKRIAKEIERDFRGQKLVILCVLKGSFIFCVDLMRELSLPVKIEFIQLASYGDETETSGNVKLNLDITGSIHGENVLIIEDIVDTGHTMKFLKDFLRAKGAKSVRLASLLYKPSRNVIETEINYLAFEIEDKFVVGYGLDYAQRYRELPYIGILNNE